ncbi:MAG: cytochrome c peroxidase [Saprospiraceae bacterium]|jgi:cytochrome c peroxidase
MRKISLVFTIVAITVFSCTKDRMPTLVELDNQLRNLVSSSSPNGKLDFYVLPSENNLDEIPQDPNNPLTEAKVKLGKFMFFDTGLATQPMKPSGLGTYSCSSCHIAEGGFKPGTFQGIADGGVGFGINGENRLMNNEYTEDELDVQDARAISLVNVAYVTNTFWNGQFGATGVNKGTEDVWNQNEVTMLNNLGLQGIETQNLIGLHDHRIVISKDVLDQFGYTEMFDEVFNDIPVEERYTTETASLAFSAYIRTIISNKAPFQNWLKGNEEAMGYKEKKGAILFFSKANCYTCHYNENLGSPEFHALGVNDMYQQPSYSTSAEDSRNLGRGGFTQLDEDLYKFKVPGIYNNADADFFFHGSSAKTLDDLIEYKNNGTRENMNVPESQMSVKFKPLNLTAEEKEHLKAFIKVGLSDPNMVRYKPTSVPSGFCFPNADPQSILDLGCE